MTILVGGIPPDSSEQLLSFLARQGHSVFFAPNGHEVIRLVQVQPFDLIIMDMDMPLQDGFKTLEKLKSNPDTAHVPVVLTVGQTSRLMPHLRELTKFLRQNTVAILDKPVNLKEIQNLLAHALKVRTGNDPCLTNEIFSQLAEEELAHDEAELAQVHLSQCKACQNRYDEWKRAESLLRDLFRTAMTIRMEPSRNCLSPWKLTAYFRGSLSVDERARLEEHLSRCSYCTRELVALHRLMKEFDEKEPEPLSEEMLNRLMREVRELVRKARGSLICLQCLGSIPIGSETCPQCGAVVREEARDTTRVAQNEDPDSSTYGRDETERRQHPNIGYLGTRKVQVAASLVGLAFLTAAALGGLAVYRCQRNRAITRAAFERMNAMFQRPEETVREAVPEAQIEEKIEVFGQVAMFEQKPERFPVPEYVDRTARALVKQHYYDKSIAQRALQRADIHDVFDTLNRLEMKRSKSRFLPKFPNRILSPDDVRVLKGELSGGFAGIGVAVRRSPDGSGDLIIGFSPDSSAKEAALQIGDVITGIDGRSVRGLDALSKANLMRGPVSTRVELTVARGGVPDFAVSIMRRQTKIPATHAFVPAHHTGYVFLSGLVDGVLSDIETAAAGFKKQGCRSLILDLRQNTGGSLEIAERIAGLFLPKGVPVSRIEDRNGANVSRSDREPVWNGPMVVIVDGRTVSGGELIAAVLKDNGRAIVIGESTAGKGSVQTAYKLSHDCGIQITTATLSGPNGQTFNNCGVEPDVRIRETGRKGPISHVPNVSEDASLEAALKAFERS